MEQIPSPVPSPTTAGPPNYSEMSTGNAKILQNLLYGHAYLPNPYTSAAYMDDPFRPRSGSLLSLGSTGSSHRTERSPSRESNSSHESLLRASPISLAPESPSPSPPTSGESKLFNILKGNLSSPYSSLFSNKPQPKEVRQSSGLEPAHQAPRRQLSLQETPRLEPPPTVTAYNIIKRQVPADEGPMDLSFKKSKMEVTHNNPPRRFTMPSATITKANAIRAKMAAVKTHARLPPPPPSHHEFLEPISPPPRVSSRESVQSNEDSGSSILRCILAGGGSGGGTNVTSPRHGLALMMNRDRQAMSAPTSPAAQTFSAPPSPSPGHRLLMGSSPCDQNQRVTIAKKTVYPVRARVTDWLQKIVQFCGALPDFSSLDPSEQLILVTKTWSRLLVLFMAEHHFEFAVTPVVLDSQPEAEQDTGRSDLPTMKSVEGIESFIKKCQNLGLDAIEYQCIKTAVLYQTGK